MRLLIADDELSVRRLVRFIVDKYCPDAVVVGEACNGREAVEKAVAFKPDVLLTDIRMPELDGLAAAREAKKALPHLQVVLLTAYEEFDYAKEALGLKAQDYLVKPVKPADLKKALSVCACNLQQEAARGLAAFALHSMLLETKPYLRTYFLKRLLEGQHDAAGLRRLSRLVNFPPGPYHVLLLRISPALKQSAERELVEKVVRPLCANGLLTLIEQSEAGLVILTAGRVERSGVHGPAWVREWAEAMRRKLEREASRPVTVAIGGLARDVTEVAQAYQEARTALSFSFVLGPGKVICSEDISQGKPEYSHLLPLKMQLATAVQNGSASLIHQCMTELSAELWKMAFRSPDLARKSAEDVCQVLLDSAREAGVDEQGLKAKKEGYYAQVLSAETCSQMTAALSNLAKDLAVLVHQSRAHKDSQTIHQARIFIETNYRRDLTLQDVARSVYLSPYYFSRLFKRETGVNFAKYLSLTRINAAKKLMAQYPGMVLKEIAAQVGYHDPRYFSSVFKRLTGVLPSEYRGRARAPSRKGGDARGTVGLDS
ncbi:MAG: two-component system, response regulator YesN [Bacillota bacterium]|nr:two-component system, response regulator YesN [Bacillota bacterium]